MAYVRFDAGAVATYDLVSCDDDACAAPVAAQPTISIPAGAASMEMWFATSGRSCGTHWDSNYGANYPFRVDSPAPLAASPTWIGNAIVHISRDPRDPCDGGSDAAHGFSFGTWARQRAAVHNACFEVWQPGVTDWDNPDLWRQLDVRVHYRFAAGAPFAWSYVSIDRRAGHNARYAWDVASLDPFGHRRCPQVPYTRGAHAVRARVDYFFSVNGAELRPSGADSLFSGEYVDYPTNPYRDHNCP